MKKNIFVILTTALLVGGCGSKGTVELISEGARVQAPEIQADFLNLPPAVVQATPTVPPAKGGGKKAKKQKAPPSPSTPTLTLGQLKGKVVVLDFWATWCGPCRMELPYLVKLYNAYHSKGLEMVGLSVELNDGQPKDYFRQFISNFQINYPVGLASMDTARAYGINPIPATFFIDKKGRVALSFIGVHPEEQFTEAIEKLLSEQ